jgi:hypothetical protein
VAAFNAFAASGAEPLLAAVIEAVRDHAVARDDMVMKSLAHQGSK